MWNAAKASYAPAGNPTAGVEAAGPSTLEYAVVRYAGHDMANVELFGAEARLSDCTISDSAVNGIYAEDAQLHLERSQVNQNATKGLYYYGNTVPISPILLENDFSGNGIYAAYLILNGGCGPLTEIRDNTGSGNGEVNGFFVEGFVLPSEDCHLAPNPGFPYVVWSIPIHAGGRLQLNPGVVVKFVAAKESSNPPQWKRGTGTLLVSGTLDAQGTLNEPIALTSFWDDTIGGDTNGDGNGSQPIPGDWIGLVLQPGSHTSLDYTSVQYAGATGASVSVVDAALELDHGSIAFGGDNGLSLSLSGPGVEPIVRNTTFVGNQGYAATVRASSNSPIRFEFQGNESGPSYSNGANGILLDVTLDTQTLLANPSLPYLVQNVIVPAGKTVSVLPGTVFKADVQEAEGGSQIQVLGVLQAQGQQNSPVTFTSLHDDSVGGNTLPGNGSQPQPGDWIGLVLQPGSHTSLDYTSVQYAGATGASVSVVDAALELDHGSIAFGGDKGLSLSLSGPGVKPIVRNTTFVGNQGYAATVRASSNSPIRFEFQGNESSPSYSNGANGILLDVTLDTQTLLANPTLPYVVQKVVVPVGKTVSISPGTVFKADVQEAEGGSQIQVLGVLQAQGQQNGPVTFTSLHDDSVGGNTLPGDGSQPQPGDWRGINVGTGGQTTLIYSNLLYGGYQAAGLLSTGGGHATLQHCTVAYNQSSGLSNQPGATMAVSHSVLHDNAGRGLANGGTASISQSDLYGNLTYGIYSWAAGQMAAENNYWGSVDGPAWDGYPYCNPPPAGQGDKVSCWSVDYMPFATAPFH